MIEQIETTELIEDPITGVMIDPETGEIVDVLDKPDTLEDAESLAIWLGEALTDARAHLAGLQAERQIWLDRVAEQFDADIKRAANKIEWLRSRPDWREKLEKLHDEKSNGKPSCKFGMLVTRKKKSRESLEVFDEEAALVWAESKCPEAIVVKRSISKSAVPAQGREIVNLYDSGMVWHPAGERIDFEVE